MATRTTNEPHRLTEPQPDIGQPEPPKKVYARLSPAVTGHRYEVQALRALAVLLVIGYHAWPEVVPGGYVGVDVFFAISGLLITTALLREGDRRDTVSLRYFWARRLRRLLPAALLVLGVTALVVFLAVPMTRWAQFLDELRASVLYIENFQLASSSVDYFASAEDPSPLQHYWSLSVEEQFYVLWPVLMIVALALARGFMAAPRTWVLWAVGGATAASFAFSVIRTGADPVPTYFSTVARAWEFGVGALLALAGAQAVRGPMGLRIAVGWAGLVAIVVSAFTYSDATVFPGVAATLPVLGAIAVMWAGMPRGRGSLAPVFRNRGVQRVGDLSYSAYLWHWPLIVLLPVVLGVTAGWTVALAVALTFPLAALTMQYVENPVRYGRLTRLPLRWTFGVALAGMAVLLAVAAVGDAIRERELRQAADRTRATLASGPPCFGAASRDPEQPCVNRQLELMVVPTPLEAKETENAPCEIVGRGERLRVCRFGAEGDDPTVALIGDSHASAWRAPVDRVAQARGLQGVSLTYTGCPFSTAVRDVPEPARGRCEQFRDEVFAWLEGQPQIRTVVTVALAGGSGVVADGGRTQEQAAADGYADAWRRLPDTVEQIIVVRDNPKAGKGTDECVQRAIDAKRPAGPACAISRAEALDPDPQVAAASQAGDPRVSVVDLTDRFCDDRRCYPVVGGALVHRDQDHINPVFGATLAPALDRALPPTLG